MTRVGAVFNPYHSPPEALRTAAQTAEAAGIAELWLWEDCFRESAFASAAAALAWTDQIQIGIGIAPMPLRNVAATAMEIATIERMFPGRLLPGVGHGVLPWMAQVGARVASPLTLMREYIPSLRSLLAGEQVTVTGRYVTLDQVQLNYPPEAAPPIYAAAEGPKTLALAGEIADGVILVGERTPAKFAEQIATVQTHRSQASRAGTADAVAYVTAAFGPDAEPRVRAELDGPRIDEDRAVWGTPDDVAAAVTRFASAGIDRIVLVPPAAEPDLEGFLKAVGEVTRLVA